MNTRTSTAQTAGAKRSPQTTHVSLDVTGMTCASCERRITKAVGKLPGVVSVSASSTRGRVEIDWSSTPQLNQVAATLNGLGYSLGKPAWITNDKRTWDTFVTSVVIVAVLYAIASLTGLTKFSTTTSDLKTGGLVVVLLLGLAAGVSTCMALTGGLVLAVSAANVAKLDRANPNAELTTYQRLRPIIMFVTGRIVGFTILGSLLGLIGGSFNIPTPILAVMMLAVGAVMFVLGVRLTDMSPRIAGWSPTLPSGMTKALKVEEQAEGSYSNIRTALLGAATFFLPCGFTQAAQLFALSTGSPIYAAAIMATFAIGTAPGLFVLGGLPELLPRRFRTPVLRGLGVLVIAFALINLSAGLHLAGIDISHPFGNPNSATASAVSSNVTVSDSVQVLNTSQDGDGYSPSNSVVYAGMPIKWNMYSKTPVSCSIFLRVPSLGISTILKDGNNTFDIPAQQPGTIQYTCSMGMYRGSITVIPKPAPSVAPSAGAPAAAGK